MKPSTYYIIAGVAIAIIAVFVFGSTQQGKTLGGTIHNTVETFTYGLNSGDADNAGCIKMENTSKTGYVYIYTLSTGAVSSSATSPFAGACPSN